MAWRVLYGRVDTDEAFRRLLAFMRRHRGAVDELALFDTMTHHQYVRPGEQARRAARLGVAIRRLKRAGVPRVGINVLCTIGHINEAWDYNPPLPYQRMVGHDGSVSRSCACPNTAEFRAYVRRQYQRVALARPDFIWVDDDIRMHHHGVTWGCFCPTCLAIFSRSVGRRWTRAALVKALDDPSGGALRQAWVEQNTRTIEKLLALIEETVHGVDPRIETGLMTAGAAWSTYSGHAFGRWFGALGAVRARPGGGFYDDGYRLGLFPKTFDTGLQRAGLPPAVTNVQYELENFPYQALRKAPESMMNECTLALAAGLNGIAFNTLGMADGRLDDYHAIADHAEAMRGTWDSLVRHAAGLPTAGLWPAWSPQITARRTVRRGESWFGGSGRYDFMKAMVLAEIGLPLAEDRGRDTILVGRVAEALADDELTAILSGGVLLDSEALLLLWERGLGPLAGVRVARRLDNGVVERLTDDPLNGRWSGEVRDARIEFWGNARGQADVLLPLNRRVRILTRMENYYGRPVGIGMTAYENERGGRAVVMGYAPWMFVHSTAKRTQLQNAADWLTLGRLPVRVEETVTVTPVVRWSADRRRGAVVLFNHGLASIPSLTIRVRAPAGPVRRVTPHGLAPVRTQRTREGWSAALGPVPPWSVEVLLFGEGETPLTGSGHIS